MSRLLSSPTLQHEAGIIKVAHHNYLVAMYCAMPGLTAEMINWRFWWHPKNDLRYQIWFPYAHHTITYDQRNKNYFEQEQQPIEDNNIQRRRLGARHHH